MEINFAESTGKNSSRIPLGEEKLGAGCSEMFACTEFDKLKV